MPEFFTLNPGGGGGVTPNLDQVLAVGNSSSRAIITGNSTVNGSFDVANISTFSGTIIALNVATYSAGGTNQLIINSTTGHVEKIAATGVPTLDQVLTSGNTSSLPITTGAATIDGAAVVSGILTISTVPNYSAGGNNQLVINSTTGHVEKISATGVPTLDQVLTSGNTSSLAITTGPARVNGTLNVSGEIFIALVSALNIAGTGYNGFGTQTPATRVDIHEAGSTTAKLRLGNDNNAWDITYSNTGIGTERLNFNPGGGATQFFFTESGQVNLANINTYSTGGNRTLVLNSTSGFVESIVTSVITTPTLDQVLTAGNTSAQSITTGTANVNGNLIVSGAGGVGSSFTVGTFILAAATATYTTGGNTTLVLNSTTGHVEKISSAGVPSLDQVLTAGNTSTQSITTGNNTVNGNLTVSGVPTLNSVATYSTGGNTTLVLNSTTGHIEKVTGGGGTPTLDQVLTAGNTSAQSITTGTANVNGSLIVSGAGGVGSSFTVGTFILAAATATYSTGGNHTLVLNDTTGHVEKITGGGGTPTLDQVLTAGNTSTQNLTANIINSASDMNCGAALGVSGTATLNAAVEMPALGSYSFGTGGYQMPVISSSGSVLLSPIGSGVSFLPGGAGNNIIITDPTVMSSSTILLTLGGLRGGTPGILYVTNQIGGQFQVNSTNVLDTSNFYYFVFNGQ